MAKSSDNSDLVSFGKKLKIIRKSKNLSLEMLANMAEIDLSGLHRIESGKNNPKLTTVLLLAKTLEVSPKDLFD